jgi:hypothetical protein
MLDSIDKKVNALYYKGLGIKKWFTSCQFHDPMQSQYKYILQPTILFEQSYFIQFFGDRKANA